MEIEMLYCPTCACLNLAETPPCPDGHHPGECPDRACVECGTALVLGVSQPGLIELVAGSTHSTGSADRPLRNSDRSLRRAG